MIPGFGTAGKEYAVAAVMSASPAEVLDSSAVGRAEVPELGGDKVAVSCCAPLRTSS